MLPRAVVFAHPFQELAWTNPFAFPSGLTSSGFLSDLYCFPSTHCGFHYCSFFFAAKFTLFLLETLSKFCKIHWMVPLVVKLLYNKHMIDRLSRWLHAHLQRGVLHLRCIFCELKAITIQAFQKNMKKAPNSSFGVQG